MDKQSFLTAAKRMSRYKSSIDNSLLNADLFWCRIYTISDVRKNVGAHSHKYYELHYVLSGEMQITFINKYTISVKSGQFILVPPSLSHDSIAIGDDFLKMLCRFSVQRSSDFAEDALESTSDTVEIFRSADSMRPLVDLMLESALCARPDVNAMISNYLECFLMDSLYKIASDKALAVSEKSNGAASKQRVIEIEEFIKSNIGSLITCEDVAGYFNMTLRHLNRLTNEHLGVPVSKLVAKHKVNFIKELLNTTDLTPRDISEMTGFRSEYALSRFFKQHEGISISSYKKNIL